MARIRNGNTMTRKIAKDSLFRFSDLIDLLYQAPTHKQGFQPFLDQLVIEFNLADAVFHIQNTSNQAIDSAWIAGPKTDVIIEYIENNLEEGNYIHDYIDVAPPSRFYTLLNDIGRPTTNALSPSQKLVEQWFDGNDLLDVSSARIGKTENKEAMISIHRDNTSLAFTPDDILILNELIPHIQRAFTLYQQFKEIRNETSNLSNLIAQLPHGALLYDSKGGLICVNQKAIQLGELHDCLAVTDNSFSITTPIAKGNYISNLYQVLKRNDAKSKACRVTHINDSQSPLTILLVPIGIENPVSTQSYEYQTFSNYEIGAIVYIYDRQHPIHVNSDFLKAIFDLTETETSICELIARGYNRNEIAEMLQRSTHTIKDHIKSVFVKTGSHSQSDLVATILTSPVYPSM
ncbi:helix-turn-helix transcriptional regulator [Vibrio mediterranei]|uniref:helix-turn-helix transcriptional regulator n=2 Tax=Vibrionaceae TaxID=641 RepID=UPI0012EAA60B|nr:helix-turn-helix transcriptional regulator [Vibrio mediterranei]